MKSVSKSGASASTTTQSVVAQRDVSDPPPANGGLSYSNVSKSYGKNRVLDGLNLSLDPDQTVGLVGVNGAGKSTMLRLAMGMIRADGGEVSTLGGHPFEHRDHVRQHIGFVPDRHFLYRWMTVGSCLRFVSPLYPTWDVALQERLLEQFDLEPDRRLSDLSHGMLAKVALIIALAHRPPLMLMDEPISSLDPISREDFLESFRRVRKQAKALAVFSSHQLEELREFVDRIVIIHQKRVAVNFDVRWAMGHWQILRLRSPQRLERALCQPQSFLPVGGEANPQTVLYMHRQDDQDSEPIQSVLTESEPTAQLTLNQIFRCVVGAPKRRVDE